VGKKINDMKKTTTIFFMLLSFAAFAQTPNGLAPAGSSDPTMGGDLSGTVSNAQIVANAIGTAELSDGKITLAKLDTFTANRLLLTNGSGRPVEGTLSGILGLSSGVLSAIETDGSTTNEIQNVSYTASTRAVAMSLGGTGFTFPLLSSTDAGLAPSSGGGTTNFLRADGTWTAPAGTGDNLGNHSATQDIDMNSHDLTEVDSLTSAGSITLNSTSSQNPIIISGSFHSLPIVRGINASGNAGIFFENVPDNANSYLFGRMDDGKVGLFHSDTEPFSTSDDTIFIFDPTTRDINFLVDDILLNGAPLSAPDVADGVWTPTLTNTTNISASTAYECQYLRVGNTVTFSGQVDIDVASTGTTVMGMSLPIASDFTTTQQAGGTGAALDNETFKINASTANDRLTISFTAVGTANNTFNFSGSYRIQ